jgi:ribose transport system substrate-binding protein
MSGNRRSGKVPKPSRQLDRYWVPIVGKTLDLLDCFSSHSEQLTLEEVVLRTGIPHTTAYRILHTLVVRNHLHRSGNLYGLNRLRKRLRLGFANLSKHISLAVEIERSLQQATATAGIDLLVWDNQRNAEIAIQNAEEMAASELDLAIEFQLFEHVAPVIADILSRSGVPLISVVNPHHGTLYFGVDNYRAGFSAGLALAEFTVRQWGSRPDAILLLESPLAGRTVQSRMVGVLRGIEERIGPLNDRCIQHVDGAGDKAGSHAAMEDFLSRHPARRILIAGINDESAIGAVQALRGANGAREFAVVGHGGSAEILDIIADPSSACIGTVSFRAEMYGPGLVNLAVPMLQGKSTTPAHYVPHEFLGNDAVVRALVRSAP